MILVSDVRKLRAALSDTVVTAFQWFHTDRDACFLNIPEPSVFPPWFLYLQFIPLSIYPPHHPPLIRFLKHLWLCYSPSCKENVSKFPLAIWKMQIFSFAYKLIGSWFFSPGFLPMCSGNNGIFCFLQFPSFFFFISFASSGMSLLMCSHVSMW